MRNETLIPIAQFLTRAWAERNLKVTVRRVKCPYTNRSGTICIPPPSKFPSSDKVSAYRLWRESLWHEAMHHYLGTFKRTVDHNDTTTYDTNEQHIINIIEDYIISVFGTREYPGMEREHEFSKAVYFALAPEPANILEEFMQLTLFGRIKNQEPTYEVQRATDFVKQQISQGNLNSPNISETVCKILGLDKESFDDIGSIRYTRTRYGKKLKGKEISEAVEQWCNNNQNLQKKLLEVNTEIQKEIQQLRETDNQIKKTTGGWTGINRNEELNYSGIEVIVPTVTTDEVEYYDMGLITRLKAVIRRVKRGWTEVHDYSGEFDVDSYVAKAKQCFINEQQLKVGGYSVLLLLDHSGSIYEVRKPYKTATISLCEALSELGIDFAVYAFATSHRVKLYLIKSFDEKWTRISAKRLTSVDPCGPTPLSSIYSALSSVARKKKRLIFITLTDGSPDVRETTKDMIRCLRKHCRMVAVGFDRSMEKVVELADNLKDLGYDRCVALDNIHKLPEKVLGLIHP